MSVSKNDLLDYIHRIFQSNTSVFSRYCHKLSESEFYNEDSAYNAISYMIGLLTSKNTNIIIDFTLPDLFYFENDNTNIIEPWALFGVLNHYIKINKPPEAKNAREKLEYLIDNKFLKFFNMKQIKDFIGEIDIKIQPKVDLYADIDSNIFDFIKGSLLDKTLIKDQSVTIFGYPKSVLGLGEDARRLCDVFLNIGFRVELVDFSSPSFPRSQECRFYDGFLTSVPTAKLQIFCMPLTEISRNIVSITGWSRVGKYVIAYSPWELDRLPLSMKLYGSLFDEIWCSSIFQTNVYKEAFAEKTKLVPFYVKSYPVDTKQNLFGIFDGSLVFLCAFDFNSTANRKNPYACVTAFRIAFPNQNEKVKLVIKTINSEKHAYEMRLIKEICGGDTRIYIIDGPLDAFQMHLLLARTDIYLSLHRSEGFGRILAEAMLCGTPVISTDWSGPTDFINTETGFPVSYSMKALKVTDYPMAVGLWAEPNISNAAEIMHKIFNKNYDLLTYSRAARNIIVEKFSLAVVSTAVLDRVNAIVGLNVSDDFS